MSVALRRLLRPRADPSLAPRQVAGWLLVCAMAYGLVMASYGGWRPQHLAYVAFKVPLLLGLSFGLALPSFFVLTALLGLRRDFAASWRALLRAQAALAVTLAALAPYTALAYASGVAYQAALLVNAGAFALAALGGQLLLRALYRPLIARDGRHRWGLRLWFVLYAFVGIQLGWVLRPFVGSPDGQVAFLREEAWGNAYVVVWGLLRGLL